MFGYVRSRVTQVPSSPTVLNLCWAVCVITCRLCLSNQAEIEADHSAVVEDRDESANEE